MGARRALIHHGQRLKNKLHVSQRQCEVLEAEREARRVAERELESELRRAQAKILTPLPPTPTL